MSVEVHVFVPAGPHQPMDVIVIRDALTFRYSFFQWPHLLEIARRSDVFRIHDCTYRQWILDGCRH